MRRLLGDRKQKAFSAYSHATSTRRSFYQKLLSLWFDSMSLQQRCSPKWDTS